VAGDLLILRDFIGGWVEGDISPLKRFVCDASAAPPTQTASSMASFIKSSCCDLIDRKQIRIHFSTVHLLFLPFSQPESMYRGWVIVLILLTILEHIVSHIPLVPPHNDSVVNEYMDGMNVSFFLYR